VTVAAAITPLYLHPPNFLQKTPAKKLVHQPTTPAKNARLKTLLKIFSQSRNTTNNHAAKQKTQPRRTALSIAKKQSS
jgi:hypothetical protein